ncbi:hypothetical protein C3747_2g232 [Trypanosoma cruzi]|uniref:DUF6787 domain-containing protein n=2 Tax=Trypanosoma cruzi TaxID=5693 RepID=Q4D5Y2_TRYCC|nr:hypothetical protein, conserved [Trypanosoma cruzi]EAN87937.1 hypothetical protein, conserved [Trypanosoma cruzi]KAF8292631.1 hypothetical protein TcYC6_0114020 [Trypanosoma cruzi]PWV21643.1 hypothetical protein C3747_2g232 [Trypanosoma cruzi]RNC61619.1 hypothetical protein TcCL_ESM00698 [Trypanosoma cruzi]|eukprot:XP_809788.1 hypothetical protein [Trypanosoma cruzi strain CL Brener]
MYRRLTALCPVYRLSGVCGNAVRKCSSQTVEGALGSKVGEKAGVKSTAAFTPTGPKRKDWRTHKEVVYVKGIPMKGSIFKLPIKEQILICVIFSITGAAAVMFVRPVIRSLVKDGFLGLPEDSGWVKGPWLYRFLYIAIMYPAYSLLLFIIGSIFGRRVWFSFMIHKMWSRFLTKNAARRLEYFLDLQHY